MFYYNEVLSIKKKLRTGFFRAVKLKKNGVHPKQKSIKHLRRLAFNCQYDRFDLTTNERNIFQKPNKKNYHSGI